MLIMFFLQLVNETSLYMESPVHRAQNLAYLFSGALACCKAQYLLPECWFSVDTWTLAFAVLVLCSPFLFLSLGSAAWICLGVKAISSV